VITTQSGVVAFHEGLLMYRYRIIALSLVVTSDRHGVIPRLMVKISPGAIIPSSGNEQQLALE
jgi:hypothetical protein